MTEQMKHFLTELAELMERYDISEGQVTESSYGWSGSLPDGIEFTINGKWDDNGDTTQEFCEFELPTHFDAETIRKLVEGKK